MLYDGGLSLCLALISLICALCSPFDDDCSLQVVCGSRSVAINLIGNPTGMVTRTGHFQAHMPVRELNGMSYNGFQVAGSDILTTQMLAS